MDDKIRTITDEKTGATTALKVLNGGVSDEQISAWKKEHRKISAVEVIDGDELYIGYFRRPTMETMSAVNRLAKVDEVKSSSAMFDNCWLGGDALMKTDVLIRMAATGQLAGMFNAVTSELKNL